MASSGKEKFDKYFKGKKDVATFCKGATKGKPVPVFKDDKSLTKVDTLKDGDEIVVQPGPSFSGRYFAKYKGGMGFFSDTNVGKPKVGKSIESSQLSRITASDFINLGKDVTFIFGDNEVLCKEFTSRKQLVDSMIDGMKKTKGVSEAVSSTFTKFLKEPSLRKIEWDADTTVEEKKKFGVYFGELLIGLYALDGKATGHISSVPWKGKPSRFLIPTDPSFSGVDSFLVMDDGEIVSISSKFGEGAKASFFSNLLIKGLQYSKKLPKCVFKEIVDTALSIGVTVQHLEKKQKAKPILYEYGVRHVLGIPKTKIRDSYQVFTDLKLNKVTDERNLLISSITNYEHVDPKIVSALEASTTAFFCRTIAKMLTTDTKSMEVMLEILSGKNYWQANLNMSSWDKGDVKFSLVNSGKSKLEIIGNKAAMTDLGATQGMINYVLKVL